MRVFDVEVFVLPRMPILCSTHAARARAKVTAKDGLSLRTTTSFGGCVMPMASVEVVDWVAHKLAGCHQPAAIEICCMHLVLRTFVRVVQIPVFLGAQHTAHPTAPTARST